MKNLKNLIILGAAMAVAAISIGATGQNENRPALVAEDQWVALNDRAGFAVLPETKTNPLRAELYLKTGKGWHRATLENPSQASLLSR